MPGDLHLDGTTTRRYGTIYVGRTTSNDTGGADMPASGRGGGAVTARTDTDPFTGEPAPRGPAIDDALAGHVLALDHVGVAVADMDAAKRWYAEHLGFPCVHEEVNDEMGVREAMLAVGSSGSYVQLLAPLGPDTTIGRFLARSGPGVQQVAYRVRDLDGLTERLRASGVRVVYPEARGGTAGSRVNFIHPKDAGGVLIELVEPPAAG
jgi:methylmalonyl-CoA/ethylmalonyl-CoA epimerase